MATFCFGLGLDIPVWLSTLELRLSTGFVPNKSGESLNQRRAPTELDDGESGNLGVQEGMGVRDF